MGTSRKIVPQFEVEKNKEGEQKEDDGKGT
jgi:hypothetical protein